MKKGAILLNIVSAMIFAFVCGAVYADQVTNTIDYSDSGTYSFMQQHNNFWITEVQVNPATKTTPITAKFMDLKTSSGDKEKDIVLCPTYTKDIPVNTTTSNCPVDGMCGMTLKFKTMPVTYTQGANCRLAIVDCNTLPGVKLFSSTQDDLGACNTIKSSQGYSAGYATGYVLFPNTAPNKTTFSFTVKNSSDTLDKLKSTVADADSNVVRTTSITFDLTTKK